MIALLLLQVVDAAFPGGNIVVDKVEGDEVALHQDLRDTEGDWFYWHFRVQGAAGRTLRFRFTKGNVIGVLGPAVSVDGGESWAWLGKAAVEGASFRYAFAPEAKDVRFCVSIPYLEKDLVRFLGRHPDLKVETLCESRKGRKIERLHAGRGATRVLLTARHHACEMIANYVLEGVLETVLSDGDDGRWFRANAEVLAIPFVDKDGVEDGDQGKNRKPRDHNRDYDGESVHPATRALREFVPKWSDGKLRLALDMHCPTLRGDHNETIYFVGSEDQKNWARVQRLSELLESVQEGPLPFRAKENIPFGTAWNTEKNFAKGMSFARWAATLPGIHAASTIEISYANANGKEVNAASARALGRDLARAMRRFLEEVSPKK